MPKSRIILSLAFCAMLFLTGCHKSQKPDNVMDTATLADFLTEAQLIESHHYTIVKENPDSLGYQTAAAYDSLYAKHGVTPSLLDSTMDYYSHYPKILEEVYSRVIDRLRPER